MKLSLKSLAISIALLWGLSFLFVSLINLFLPSYGGAFLELMSSIYPGYKPVGTLNSVVVGTLYALVDGAVGGVLLGWFYNLFAP